MLLYQLTKAERELDQACTEGVRDPELGDTDGPVLGEIQKNLAKQCTKLF